MRTRPLAIAALGAALAALLIAAAGSSALGPYPPLGQVRRLPAPGRERARERALAARPARLEPGHLAGPVNPHSSAIIDYIDAHGGDFLHPDFGSPRRYGFPYRVVGQSTAAVPVHFTAYGDRVRPRHLSGPAERAGRGRGAVGGDRHVIAYDRSRCLLYELGRGFPRTDLGRWDATVGVIWDLSSAGLRTDGWTSADAAGLPIFPGLARYDEVGGRPHRPRDPGHLRRHPRRVDPPGLALRGLDSQRIRATDGHAPAPRTPTTTSPASPGRPWWSPRRSSSTASWSPTTGRTGSSAARRQPLGRRRSQPAQGDPRLGVRGRALGGLDAPLLSAALRPCGSRPGPPRPRRRRSRRRPP